MFKIGLKALFLLAFALMIASCSDSGKKPQNEEEYLNAAKTLYDSALVKKDNDLFAQAINTYKDFIKNYPNSEKVLTAYNQIAGIYFDNLQNYQEAINTYREIIDKYPDKKEAKQSLFMIAFIYDESLKDKENAKITYKQFLEKYPEDTDPNDKMSESAKRMLEVIETGKSIEEIILNSIESQNKETKTEEKTDVKSQDDGNVPPKEKVKPKKVDDATSDQQ